MTITLVDYAPPLNGKPLRCFGLNWPEVRVISAAGNPTHEQLCELSLDCLNAFIIQNFIKLRSVERNRRQVLATIVGNVILEQRRNGFQVSNGEVAMEASLFQSRQMEQEGDDRPFIGIGIFESEILEMCSEGFARDVVTWSDELTAEHIRFLLWSNVRTPVPYKGKMPLALRLCDLIREFRERGSIGMQYVNDHGDVAIMPFSNGAAVPGHVHPVAHPARLEIQPLVVFEFALPALPVAYVHHSPERTQALPEDDANDQGLDELERAARSLDVAAAKSKAMLSTARALERVTRTAWKAAARATRKEQKQRRQFERLQLESRD